VGNFSFLLWAISFWFRHWKNFKNRQAFAKVTVKIKVAQFFYSQCISSYVANESGTVFLHSLSWNDALLHCQKTTNVAVNYLAVLFMHVAGMHLHWPTVQQIVLKYIDTDWDWKHNWNVMMTKWRSKLNFTILGKYWETNYSGLLASWKILGDKWPF